MVRHLERIERRKSTALSNAEHAVSRLLRNFLDSVGAVICLAQEVASDEKSGEAAASKAVEEFARARNRWEEIARIVRISGPGTPVRSLIPGLPISAPIS